jgi:hypothetical protein
MTQESFVRFLTEAHRSPAMKTRYSGRNLSQLLFHAKNDGFTFTTEEAQAVVGRLEAIVIQVKDKDQYGASSRLWREMWGRDHFDYVVDHVVARLTEDELESLLGDEQRRAG